MEKDFANLSGGFMNNVLKFKSVRLITLMGFTMLGAGVSVHASEQSPQKTGVNQIIEGMVGEQPKLLCWLIYQFKDTERRSKIFLNRCLLYGPPGNGKSTVAKKIAHATDSIFIARSACSMVERFVGQGATNVVEMFAKARELIVETGKKAVIFIDEIDALAAGHDSEFRAEHKAALQQLWIELDASKNDSNMFIIFATNEFKKLSKTFLDRFGCNTIEVSNPDTQLRKQVLTHYFDRAELIIEPALLEDLSQKSKGLSIRALEDMVYGIKLAVDLENNGIVSDKIVWQTLAIIKEKFKNNISDKEDQEKWWQNINTRVSIASGVLSSALNVYTLSSVIAAWLKVV